MEETIKNIRSRISKKLSSTITTAGTSSIIVEASASARVFAIGELVDMILDYVSPNQLYALRHLNSKFMGTTCRMRILHFMFIEPQFLSLRLRHLTNLLRTENLRTCTYPFIIAVIYPSSATNDFVIQLDLDSEAAQMSNKDLKATLRKNRKAPYQSTATWRKVLLCPLANRTLRLDIQTGGVTHHAHRYGAGKKVKLERLLQDAERVALPGIRHFRDRHWWMS